MTLQPQPLLLDCRMAPLLLGVPRIRCQPRPADQRDGREVETLDGVLTIPGVLPMPFGVLPAMPCHVGMSGP